MSFVEDELDLVPALQNRIAELETLLALSRASDAEARCSLHSVEGRLSRSQDEVSYLTVEVAQLRDAGSGRGMVPASYLEDLGIELAYHFAASDRAVEAVSHAKFVARDMLDYWRRLNKVEEVSPLYKEYMSTGGGYL